MSGASTFCPDQESLDIVLFSAGGCRAGFEACLVRASRPAPSGTTDAGIEELLGLAPSTGVQTRQYVQLKQADEDRQILVDSPVDLVTLPLSAIHPLPPLLAARCSLKGLRALALEPNAESVILLFSAETFS
jgi:hypothetical protein